MSGMREIIPVGVPEEMKLGKIDYAIPEDAKSWAVRIQPSNVTAVSSAAIALAGVNNGALKAQTDFPSQPILFEIPCGQSPSTFLDNRLTSLSGTIRMNWTAKCNAGATLNARLRSSAASFFDNLRVVSQSGAIISEIPEYGLVFDTVSQLQMSNSVRDGTSLLYATDAGAGNNTSQGVQFYTIPDGGDAAGNQSFSFCIPILDPVIGCLNDKMFNIGRTNKLQLQLQTTSVLPISIGIGGANATAGSISFSLENLALNMEFIDIGPNALRLLDQTLVNGNAFYHGVTYKTSAVTIPTGSSGLQNIPTGIRGSSIKSLFARFHETPLTLAASCNGKYDSKNPTINQFNFSVGGINYPSAPINPLLHPAIAFKELMHSMGMWNTQAVSSIVPAQYCKLSSSGTVTGAANGSLQDWYYASNATTLDALSSFFLGINTEVVARRGALSGLNAQSSPIFLNINIATATGQNHNAYVIGLLDTILVHDVSTGELYVRQ